MAMASGLRIARITFKAASILLVAAIAYLVYSCTNAETVAMKEYIRSWNQEHESKYVTSMEPAFLHSTLVGQSTSLTFIRTVEATAELMNSVDGASSVAEKTANSLEFSYNQLLDSGANKNSESYTIMLALHKIAYRSLQSELAGESVSYSPGDGARAIARGLPALQGKLVAEALLETLSICSILVGALLAASSLCWEHAILRHQQAIANITIEKCDKLSTKSKQR